MEKLHIGETLYLEGKREYMVASIVKKNNEEYIYIVTTQEPYIIKFAKVTYNNEKLNLEIVHDQKLKEELLNLFQKEAEKLTK